jgi:DNA (cytosine-5)-methyltransferase 1
VLSGLDLFSGIGGLTLALGPWVRPVAYCENDAYAQAVLLSRMRDGRLPQAPIWDDVRTLDGRDLPPIDIIYGGFPCQDLSVAGAGAGLQGERSSRFFDVVRLIRELRPRHVFLENVPAIATRGLSRVLMEIASVGYNARWTTLSAGELGAPHLRERWWLYAYPDSLGREVPGPEPTESPPQERTTGVTSVGLVQGDLWNQSPGDVYRMDDGLPLRTLRIRGLGNAVVPIQARIAWARLTGLELRRPA